MKSVNTVHLTGTLQCVLYQINTVHYSVIDIELVDLETKWSIPKHSRRFGINKLPFLAKP